MIGKSIYAYIWQTSRDTQVRICLLVVIVAFLSVLPLELQRRIVDNAVSHHEIWLLGLLGLAYLAVLLVQGGLKYRLNLARGRVLEEVSRDLRQRILERHWKTRHAGQAAGNRPMDSGTTASILTAESESIGEFASASLSTPLLQSSTIVWVMAYLIWVEPQIAALAILIYAPQAFLVPKIQRNVNRLSRRRTRVIRKLGREAVAFEDLDDGEGVNLLTRTRVYVNLIFRIRMLIYRQKYILTFLGNFLDSLGTLVVLVVGGYMVIEGQTNVSSLVVFITGFQKVSDPWDELVNFYRSVSNARVTFNLVSESLDATPQP